MVKNSKIINGLIISEELTIKEGIVMEQLIGALYAEPGFSDVSPRDLVKLTGIPMESLRGVLGSLTKKAIISIEDNDEWSASEDIVYLNEDFYYMHPEWSQDY